MSAGTEKGQSGLAYIHKCKSHVAHFLSASPPKNKKKIHPEKNFLYFLKKSFYYISENGNPEKKFSISGNGAFKARKMKKPPLKMFLIL